MTETKKKVHCKKEKQMTKIEVLRNELLSYGPPCLQHDRGHAWAHCICGDTTLETTLEAYAQAVRDEEWAASRAVQDCDGIEGIGKIGVCTLCPARGTRYCP